MSVYKGIHHVVKEVFTDNMSKSYCGRVISKHDSPIDIHTAQELVVENGRTRPCEKCMVKVDED